MDGHQDSEGSIQLAQTSYICFLLASLTSAAANDPQMCFWVISEPQLARKPDKEPFLPLPGVTIWSPLEASKKLQQCFPSLLNVWCFSEYRLLPRLL